MNKVKKSVIFTIIFAILVLLTTTSLADVNLIVNDIDVAVNGTEAKLEWSKASGATGYEVYVDLPAIGYQCVGKVTGNKVTILGFDEGEIYAVKVRAYNENGVSSTYSSEIKFITGENAQTTSKLGEVSNIKAISEGTTGTISWDGVKDANGYEIYASVRNSEYIDIGSTTSTKVKLIGMDEDEIYSIKIQPYLKQNDKKVYGSLSNLAILKYEEENVEYKKPDKVTNLQKTINNKNVVLTWNSVNNVDGYQIIVQTPGKGNAEFYSSTNKISLEGFTAGCTYTAKVRAYEYINGEKQYGDPSTSINIKIEEEKEKTKLDKVTGLKVKMNGSQATFSWNSVSKAEGYELSICIPGTGPDTIVTTTGTSKTIDGFINENDTYSVKVRAYATENGEKIYSEEYSDIVYFQKEKEEAKLDKVTGLKVKMNGSQATFSWNSVSKAEGYELSICIPGTGPDTIVTTTGTSKTIDGFINENDTYSVKVRAYATENGEKIYSEEYSDTVYFQKEKEETKLDKVTGLKVNMNGSQATFSWNSVNKAEGYEMLINIPGYGTTTTYSTSTSKTMVGFTNKDYNYSIKVRAYVTENGEKIYSEEYSDTVYFKKEKEETKLDKVTGLNVKMKGSQATFSWNSVSKAEGYQLLINIPGYGTTTTYSTSTSKTMSGFTNKDYNYSIKVRAYVTENGKKIYGDYSNTKYFKNNEILEEDKEETESSNQLAQVRGLSVSRNGTKATMSWNKVSGADGYEIVLKIPGYGNSYKTLTGTSTTMSGFTTTAYKYTVKVRAYKVENGRKVYGDYSTIKEF